MVWHRKEAEEGGWPVAHSLSDDCECERFECSESVLTIRGERDGIYSRGMSHVDKLNRSRNTL